MSPGRRRGRDDGLPDRVERSRRGGPSRGPATPATREEHQRLADPAERRTGRRAGTGSRRCPSRGRRRSPCRRGRRRRPSAARRSRRSRCRGPTGRTACTTRRGTLIRSGLSPGRYGVWGSTTWNEASPSAFATRSWVCCGGLAGWRDRRRGAGDPDTHAEQREHDQDQADQQPADARGSRTTAAGRRPGGRRRRGRGPSSGSPVIRPARSSAAHRGGAGGGGRPTGRRRDRRW